MKNQDITSWDCLQGAGQDHVPKVAPAHVTAFPSSACIRTRVPAALRAARRLAGTPAQVHGHSPARLPPPRRLRHPAGTQLPALALRLPAPPHPPPRGAHWEPLAETRGIATDLRRPGSDADCLEPARRLLGLLRSLPNPRA